MEGSEHRPVEGDADDDVGGSGEAEQEETRKPPERVEVQYCSACTLPYEFCEYVEGHPEGVGGLAERMNDLSVEGSSASSSKGPKMQSGGGKKKKKKGEEGRVRITRTVRNKKKCVTRVSGLEQYGARLQDAAKRFGKKFACGSSVTSDAAGNDEIDVQGDYMHDLASFIQSTWEVPESAIQLIDKEKKKQQGSG